MEDKHWERKHYYVEGVPTVTISDLHIRINRDEQEIIL